MAKPSKSSRLDGNKTDGDKPVKRDGNGRFVKGSASPSPGRPPLAKETAIQDVIKLVATPENLYLALEQMRLDGMAGDKKALYDWTRLSLEYLVGKPTVSVDLKTQTPPPAIHLHYIPPREVGELVERRDNNSDNDKVRNN